MTATMEYFFKVPWVWFSREKNWTDAIINFLDFQSVFFETSEPSSLFKKQINFLSHQ